jgi:hypothetical protein
VILTPAARRPSNTLLKPLGPGRWDARQRILDPEEDEDWMIHATVDFGARAGEDGALLSLQRIGR